MSLLEPIDHRLGVAVEKRDELLDQVAVGLVVDLTHAGPEHFSMWKSRHGRPSRWWFLNFTSLQVLIGKVRRSESRVSRIA